MWAAGPPKAVPPRRRKSPASSQSVPRLVGEGAASGATALPLPPCIRRPRREPRAQSKEHEQATGNLDDGESGRAGRAPGLAFHHFLSITILGLLSADYHEARRADVRGIGGAATAASGRGGWEPSDELYCPGVDDDGFFNAHRVVVGFQFTVRSLLFLWWAPLPPFLPSQLRRASFLSAVVCS